MIHTSIGTSLYSLSTDAITIGLLIYTTLTTVELDLSAPLSSTLDLLYAKYAIRLVYRDLQTPTQAH